jgi:divalent metal cation (Fe/Co/Zn/Cd) transporter
MKARFSFIDPGAIMGVVVSLIILAVGVFAFFVTIQNIPTNNDGTIWSAINNTSNTGNSVFNIIGIVLIIGAIMSIVGLVYNYVR